MGCRKLYSGEGFSLNLVVLSSPFLQRCGESLFTSEKLLPRCVTSLIAASASNPCHSRDVIDFSGWWGEGRGKGSKWQIQDMGAMLASIILKVQWGSTHTKKRIKNKPQKPFWGVEEHGSEGARILMVIDPGSGGNTGTWMRLRQRERCGAFHSYIGPFMHCPG